MLSDEKRREVARGLRRVDVFVDPMDDAEVCDRREVEHALDLENEDGWYRADDVHYLADLIDRPTCRDVGDGRQFRCSKCGCEVDINDMDGESTMWLEGCIAFAPRFCPNCGAMVTERGGCDVREL